MEKFTLKASSMLLSKKFQLIAEKLFFNITTIFVYAVAQILSSRASVMMPHS